MKDLAGTLPATFVRRGETTEFLGGERANNKFGAGRLPWLHVWKPVQRRAGGVMHCIASSRRRRSYVTEV